MSQYGAGNTGSTTSDNTWRSGGGMDPAFDPWLHPELFRGVLTRRFFAFLIDLLVLSVPVIFAVIFIAVFGVITLGLGWALFWLVSPASIVWALVYYGSSLGGPHSATLGMRVMDLEMRTWYGAPSLFPARRHPCRRVLDFHLDADATGVAGRSVQRPQAAVARHRAGNRGRQHVGPDPGRPGRAHLVMR